MSNLSCLGTLEEAAPVSDCSWNSIGFSSRTLLASVTPRPSLLLCVICPLVPAQTTLMRSAKTQRGCPETSAKSSQSQREREKDLEPEKTKKGARRSPQCSKVCPTWALVRKAGTKLNRHSTCCRNLIPFSVHQYSYTVTCPFIWSNLRYRSPPAEDSVTNISFMVPLEYQHPSTCVPSQWVTVTGFRKLLILSIDVSSGWEN